MIAENHELNENSDVNDILASWLLAGAIVGGFVLLSLITSWLSS